MFCKKCGSQIQEDSQFCQKCGASQGAIEERAITQPAAKRELDREAVKIYLSNVLALENALSILGGKWANVNREILDFEECNYREIISLSEKEQVGLLYDGKQYFMHFNVDQYGKAFIGLHWGPFCKFTWYSINDHWNYINDSGNWPSSYKCGNSLIDTLLVAPIVEASQQRGKKKQFLEAYETFKRKAPERYEQNLKKIQPVKEKRTGIEREIDKARALLKQAYSANIIPLQFRNIYAVWFIHNYMTTSNETLSAAFLHCDMDSIKNKLDTIISQQREIIMNQAILAAQNRNIMEQNQRALKHLVAIEGNTEMAAQYSQIAANNAEACAWIGVANYLR